MAISAGLMMLLLFAIVWSTFWKGWALWVAANRKEKKWFAVLLVVNTLGILDVFYLWTRETR